MLSSCRYPTRNCPTTIVLIQMQTIVGIIMEAVLTGFVFTKLSKPAKRAHTILSAQLLSALLSNDTAWPLQLFAAGCHRNGRWQAMPPGKQPEAMASVANGDMLQFRLGDMRRTQLIEAHIRLQMVCNRVTLEGALQPLYQTDLNVGYDAGMDRVFIMWPISECTRAI